jgi:YidC/Oxa1 family membrane protein insertase
MQKMDRNTIIGFVLMGILLFLYLYTSTKGSKELQLKKQAYEDSIARVNASKQTAAKFNDTAKKNVVVDSTGFNAAALNGEQMLVVENELLKITFTNKGGQPKTVELKKYNSYTGAPVKLFDNSVDKLSYPINNEGKSAQTNELYFFAATPVKTANKQIIKFTAAGKQGEIITHQYTLTNNSYFVDFDIQINGADKLLSQGNVNLQWQTLMQQQEKDPSYERQQSEISYLYNGDYSHEALLKADKVSFNKKISWVSAKHQFFNTTLIAKNGFEGGQAEWTPPANDTLKEVAFIKSNFLIKTSGAVAAIPLQLYFGPNNYKILRNSNVEDMDKLVNLGQGFYSFVRPINQFIILPVFNFFKSFIASYGVVILLLTLFIRLLTSPLVYTSYLSGAKMKALRPEIDALKLKHGDDQQQFGMDQMKLFREAGVNPLGGCIPALLQIPIFFALFSFFNSNIALRGQSFLWSKDLSVYDSIFNFGVNIPLLGNHISLFTLLAVITSFLITLYGMSNTPDQNNPVMKYMPYIFPFFLLFIFNKLPSALTWYYTVSNVVTLVLQWVIQTYVIDHEKILTQIAENRKKPKAKSKWQERLDQIQETQKKMQQNQAGKK